VDHYLIRRAVECATLTYAQLKAGAMAASATPVRCRPARLGNLLWPEGTSAKSPAASGALRVGKGLSADENAFPMRQDQFLRVRGVLGESEERDLIRRAKAGDNIARDLLWEAFFPFALAECRKQARSTKLPADIAEDEAALAIHRSRQ
jgi:hypothetical protein